MHSNTKTCLLHESFPNCCTKEFPLIAEWRSDTYCLCDVYQTAISQGFGDVIPNNSDLQFGEFTNATMGNLCLQKTLEYGFQKMGKNFSYPVSEKFSTSDNDENLLSEEFSNDLSE